MQTNKASLPVMSVQGKMDHPITSGDGYRVGHDGYGRIPMATGGIIYDYKIGGSCVGIVGDCVEPGVSLKDPVGEENNALQTFARIGDKAKVVSGDVEDKEGYMARKHGGIDHIMVYFDEETLELMTTEDKVLIRACGQRLKLIDYEEVQLMNVDPVLFEGLGIVEKERGIKMPVVACVPAYLMGSGLGSTTTMLGDYGIMTQDAQVNREFGINELHSGDLVVTQNHNNHNGPHYRREAVSISIVVYVDSCTSGYGPGLIVIMSGRCGSTELILDPDANIANYLRIKQL